MIYTEKIKMAVRFSIRTHEIFQKQKRKGKDVAYITHPLTVGIILAHAGAREDVIVAGILHDTIEDSVREKKVTHHLLAQKFGEDVADIVESVSEHPEGKTWEERKAEALSHIEKFNHGSLLVKSADVLANGAELLHDYELVGEKLFSRFGGPKEKMLKNQIAVIDTITRRWKANSLLHDLAGLRKGLQRILFAEAR